MIDHSDYNKNMKMLTIAIEYCKSFFSHEDIINTLYTDNDLKKQYCLIELKKINNQKEADIIVYNLTNQSGPIRETASFKILELISQIEFNKYFQTENILDTFVNAVTDINPAVSRNSVEIIKYVNNAQYIYEKLIQAIKKKLEEKDEDEQMHSYKVNKKNFGIYWNLEAITAISKKIKCDDELTEILEKTAISKDYTIREKTAKCAKIYRQEKIIKILKNDENIYVRKYLN